MKLSIATLLFGLLTGCATVPPLPASLDFRLSDSAGQTINANELVAPGSRIRLDRVTVTDVEGNTRRLTDADEFVVEVTGGTYHRPSRTIQLASERADVPSSGYEIRVSLKEGIVVSKRYRADFALVYGPDPETVASFGASLRWSDGEESFEIESGTPLIPGAEYNIVVVIRDHLGRTFSSNEIEHTIPRERIEVSVSGFQPLGDGLAFEATDEGPYRLRVSYAGDSRLSASFEFPYDFAISRGPMPQDVLSLDILGELADLTLISPGEVKHLKVAVTDLKGRRWVLGLRELGSHKNNMYRLPPDRLQVFVENGAYDLRDRSVRFSNNARSMLGKDFVVRVRYGGAGGPDTERRFAPDFLSIVPLMEEDELVYSGRDGSDGRPGRDGQRGSPGNESRRSEGQGGIGRSGRHGTTGQDGARGLPGPNLEIVAREVRTIDAKVQLVLFAVRAPNSPLQYFVRRTDGPPVTIKSIGGNGGRGGDGGNGGLGGAGGNGYFSGDGGDGGDSGDGGDGGEGGFGGAISLILQSYGLENAFVLNSEGGTGGQGGEPGDPGGAGSPGSINDWASSDEKRDDDAPPPEVGAYGLPGNNANAGHNGPDGFPGNLNISVDDAQAVALADRAPEEIKSAVLF